MVFYNEDSSHIMVLLQEKKIKPTRALFRDYIYSLKGTQVTDFLMNVNSTTSTSPSKVLYCAQDRYLAKEENGHPVDWRGTYLEKAYETFVTESIDMYAVWIDTLREIGIRPWLSIRMNDCHNNLDPVATPKSPYVDQHPEMHVGSYRKTPDYFSRCFDYAQKAYRDLMLAYIEEQLSRYDVDGIELDFMREIYIFRLGHEREGRAVITAFMHDVRALVDRMEEKHGHKIEISVTLPPHPNSAYEHGFDFLAMTDVIDYIAPIGRWDSTDTDMPIELWKQLLRGTGVKLGGGQQPFSKPYHRPNDEFFSYPEIAFGEAMANLSRGADFVYLYNYMYLGEAFGQTKKQDGTLLFSEKGELYRTLSSIGEKQSLLLQSRRHVVTFNDTVDFVAWRNEKLPRVFDGTNLYRPPFKINVGDLPDRRKLTLVLGFDREIDLDRAEIYVNSTACDYAGRITLEEKSMTNPCYAFDFNAEIDGAAVAEIHTTEQCALQYIEIRVIPL